MKAPAMIDGGFLICKKTSRYYVDTVGKNTKKIAKYRAGLFREIVPATAFLHCNSNF